MKRDMIKKWNQFINESFNNDEYVISDIQYVDFDDSNYIIRIDLEDGRVITTGEDTGGEDTSLEVKCKVYIGDVISFDFSNEEEHDGVKYLYGVTGINVNGKLCDCSVGSEGGNIDTFIMIK
jgi:hypothetical protein